MYKRMKKNKWKLQSSLPSSVGFLVLTGCLEFLRTHTEMGGLSGERSCDSLLGYTDQGFWLLAMSAPKLQAGFGNKGGWSRVEM